MNQELNSIDIRKKFTGKYERLYPVYEAFRDECFKLSSDVKAILKTIYILIIENDRTLYVVFWKKDGLHVAVPTLLESSRLLDAKHLKYKGMNKMFLLNNVTDIDDYMLNLMQEIYLGK